MLLSALKTEKDKGVRESILDELKERLADYLAVKKALKNQPPMPEPPPQ